MGRFLLPAATVVVPPRLAASLLVLLKPGRREWRGAIPDELVQWIADLEELAGRATSESSPDVVEVRWMTVAEAAERLGLSVRQVTAIAAKLGGRKVGRRWLLEEREVLVEAEARSAAVSGRTDAVAS